MIVGAARALLHDQGLPLHLWAEACNTTVYVQNRCPHRILGMSTPEETYSGKKPDLSHLRIFGANVYMHVTKDARRRSWSRPQRLGYLWEAKQLAQDAEKVVGPPTAQRSQRQSPDRYTEYMALMSKCVVTEPSSFEEAMEDPAWVDAMVEEYDSIVRNSEWEIVPRPEGKLVVGSRWIYKVKQAANGSVEKCKARFVA
eukprot:PITA_35680